MRKRLIPLAAIIAASACLGGSSEAPAGVDITGVYSLTILGNCIMGVYGCVYESDENTEHAIMTASVALNTDLSFHLEAVAEQRTNDANPTDTTLDVFGTYARDGGTLTMTDTAAHLVTTGKLTLNAITIETNGVQWIYRK